MFGKKKEEKKPAPPEEVTRITFEINKGGDLMIACSWPLPDNAEHAKVIATQMANAVCLINTGRLLAGTQQAIFNFGAKNKEQAPMSSAINKTITGLLEAHGLLSLLKGTSKDDDEPIISPSEAFGHRSAPAND